MKEAKRISELFDKLTNQKEKMFPEKGKVSFSNKHGVYIIYDPKKKVLHVGKTNRGKNGLNQRLQNHISNNSSFSKQYLKDKGKGKILRDGYFVHYIEEENARVRALLEALAAGKLCPAHIGTGEKRID